MQFALKVPCSSGGTTNLAEDFYVDWETTEGRGRLVARAFGLGPGRAIIEDDYGVTQIFTSGDKFFPWDQINDEMFELLYRDLSENIELIWHSEIKKKDL